MFKADERGGAQNIGSEVLGDLKEKAYLITFVRTIPKDLLSKILDGIPVEIIPDDRNPNFVKQVAFLSGDVQYYADSLIARLLRNNINPDDVVWSYEVYLELELKKKLNLLKIPSVLPLVGNVTTTGIIISNDPDLKMRVRKFTTVQIDKTVKVIKRDEKQIKIQNVISELEELIGKLLSP
ncbi:hypothetical protein [Stygiolobus azoricus]|uniref:Uncharacterized protein n=1 Tax=Stygiolobus azoricus TaxID=41675 RepID=A0A650CPN0_9CREN|nr:hypothetical protein [Stygiolobus azoricus]QGR19665.1 hypothetical protein D1868_06415 [Stygiolobus azoricus]